MSHKKRITIEVDPLHATAAIGMARMLLRIKCIELSQLPEENILSKLNLTGIWEVLNEIHDKCIVESGIYEHMENNPELVAEMEDAMEKTGLFDSLNLS